MKRIRLIFIMFLISCANLCMAQAHEVTGRVIDEMGLGLPGAGITVKGTNQGATTDPDGNFTISVPDGATTLVVQALGYATQEVSATGTNLEIRMQVAARGLNETIVTALGIRRNKNDLPYSAQKVDGSEVTKTRESNFVNSLEGKVAGLEIRRNNNLGGSTNVIMRGTKSLTGNNQALFVVDGVPVDNSNTNTADQAIGRNGYDYGNAAADINPDNVESITVLKGAAATALYGSRAANGVILVTTKKSSKAGFNIVVNTGLTTGSIDRSTWIKYQKEYGAGYGAFYESPDGYFYYRDVLGNGTQELVVPVSEDASQGARFDPKLMVYDWKSLDPLSPSYHQKTPWVAAATDPVEFFVHPFSTSNNITFSGGNEHGGFSVGYTHNSDRGIVENSSVIKDLVNVSGSYNLSKKLSITGTANVSNINGKGRYGTGYDGYNASVAGNLRQWWQMNVDVKELRDAYFRAYKGVRYNATWNYSDPDDRSPIFWNNPYWAIYENYEQDHRLRFFGNVAVNYKVCNWFDVLGRVGVDAYNEQQEERSAIGSVSTPIYTRFNRTFNELNYDLMGNFHKDLNKDFNLSGLIGTNIRRSKTESIDVRTNGGLVIPRLYAISNSVSPIAAPEETEVQIGVVGIFASATLNYKSMLILDLTGRRDQSSTLPESNNSYFYPSASLGFVFTKIKAVTDGLPWLSFGKARVNYAEVGNSAPPQRIVDVFRQATPFSGNAIYLQSDTKFNENLKPEKTKSFEGGLELNFLKNRAGLDFTYYKTNSVDQILPVAVSSASGYRYRYFNAGEVENKGIEISAFGIPVKTRDFSWTINVNFARNRNKVVSLAEGTDNLELGNFQGGVTLNAALGQPYGTIRGTDYVYLNGQKVVGADGYYEISATSNNIIGNVNPDWTGGISNTLNYKGIAFSFLIDMKKGGDLFSLDRSYGMATGLPEETVGNNDLGNPKRSPIAQGGGIILPGVMANGQPNTTRIECDYYALGYTNTPNKGFVYDASYTKLREVSLTYSLPSKWLKSLKYVKGIDVSAIGRNLWIIHKNMPGADPEDGLGSGNLQGYQTGSYPTARTYGFNVRFVF